MGEAEGGGEGERRRGNLLLSRGGEVGGKEEGERRGREERKEGELVIGGGGW